MSTATLNTGGDTSSSTLVPVLSLMAAMASLCIGTSFAKSLFPMVGAQGTTAYRIVIGALILLAIWRPWRFPLSRANALKIALYGVTLACLNLMFYMALRTLPLGIAIAIEFTGPLALAVFSSRRAIDFLWIACAAAGLLLLIPTGQSVHDLDPVGLAYALGAAVLWALYIIFGKRAGHIHGGQATSLEPDRGGPGGAAGGRRPCRHGVAGSVADPGRHRGGRAVQRAAVFAGDGGAQAPAEQDLRRAAQHGAGHGRAGRRGGAERAAVGQPVASHRRHRDRVGGLRRRRQTPRAARPAPD